MATTHQGKKRYPALDGLRGVAILLVVIMHNFRFMNYFFFGWLGVDLFFVISGFLITDILLNAVDKPRFLRNFYMRRVLRIFPVFYLALIICLFILPNLSFIHLDTNYYQIHQGWLWTYLQNWLFIFKPPYGDPILLHTWSLGVEEQFYLFWPLIILLIRKPKHLFAFALLLLIGIGIARYIIWMQGIAELSYSSLYTFTRIDGICIGSMIALLFRFNPDFLKKYTAAIITSMAFINFAFYFINGRRGFSLPYLAFVGYTTFAIIFGVLLYECVIDQTKLLRSIFTSRILSFFGRISYGLYVYHWPIYLIFFPVLSRWLVKQFNWSFLISEFVTSLSVTLLAVLISSLSFSFIEKYLLKLKNRYN
jgi:peptidoglycan/LPS O-acetylase OafA/YrhL